MFTCWSDLDFFSAGATFCCAADLACRFNRINRFRSAAVSGCVEEQDELVSMVLARCLQWRWYLALKRLGDATVAVAPRLVSGDAALLLEFRVGVLVRFVHSSSPAAAPAQRTCGYSAPG